MAAAWAEAHYGVKLRGWQRYALDRALEHDKDGRLVWRFIIITVARQSGKSWLARVLCLWRLHEGRDLFGAEQTILHVANKRETAMEVMRPAGQWAAERYGQRSVKWGNTSAGITIPAGDRWLIHAANESAGVGYSVDMAFVDEAWKIKATVVNDAIAPTMAERESSQLYLVSTAGDNNSDLLTAYRQRAIDKLAGDDPGDILLLEWSAPQDADPDDVETWKYASPEWTERRETFLRSMWESMDDPDAWKVQYLNQWVIAANSWLKSAAWKATHEPDRPLPADRVWTVACEEEFGGSGHAVAVAAQDDDGRIVVRVTLHRTIADVDTRIAELRSEHPSLDVLATPGYRDRLRTVFTMVGNREGPTATDVLLDAFERRLIAHDGNPTLLEHFSQLHISQRAGAWQLTSPMGRLGGYAGRAAMFAVWHASKVQKPAPAIHTRRRTA